MHDSCKRAVQLGREVMATRMPLHASILQWWHEESGSAITLGSDAHGPEGIARDSAVPRTWPRHAAFDPDVIRSTSAQHSARRVWLSAGRTADSAARLSGMRVSDIIRHRA